MKKIKASPFDDRSSCEEFSVFELVEKLSSFMLTVISTSNFPSLEVLNDLFSKGKLDDGMSGGAFWEKFELSEDERLNLQKRISEKYDVRFKKNEVLESLDSYKKWASKSLNFCNPRS